MRILLTGATGFLGCHVARLLLNSGYEVHAILRPESNTWRIDDMLLSLKLEYYDFTQIKDLDILLERVRPEICIHLAWHMGPGSLTDLENVEVLSSSLHLAVRLASLGCKKLVIAGTCFEYDADKGYVSESSPTKPTNLYAASKQALHSVVDQLSSITGMQISWLRLFFLYGPYEGTHRLVPSVISSLLRNESVRLTPGEQVRDFIHIEDAAHAVLAVTTSSITGAVNVGSGTPWTVRHAVSRIGAMMGRSELLQFGALEYRSGDPLFLCANNRNLIENTLWKPQFDLDNGLLQTIEWWSKQNIPQEKLASIS